MLEFLALPAIAIAAALIPKRKLKDKEKIRRILENANVCINKNDHSQYPQLIREYHSDTYSTYIYSLPFGLHSDQFIKQLPAISEGINKEVEFDFDDGVFKLFVYNQSLPDKWSFDDSLLQENTWEFAVGKNHRGIIFHDFEKYPHLLIGGVTRFGKTVLLKDILTTIILDNPKDTEFHILDLKGGLEFYKFKSLPQVKEVACDIFEAAEQLMTLTEQLKKDEAYFLQNGYTNIVDTPIKKRKFIIVDESAQLSPTMYKDKTLREYAQVCQNCLSELARVSGGLGYRLIISTQYPVKEAVPMAIKANIVARIAFICANNVASRVILDDIGAEDLPSIPGRCIYLVDKQRILQVPYLDDKKMFRLMEEREDEILGENRTIINDDRQIRGGNNKTSSWNTRS